MSGDIVVEISVYELAGDSEKFIREKISSQKLMFVSDGLFGPKGAENLSGVIGNEVLKLVCDPERIKKIICVYKE